jgi:peptide deformylase
LTIEYFDENFELKEEKYDGLIARVIQHEYDHVDGVLFTDHLNPIKKKFLKKKLDNISKGIVDVDYKMKFPKKR